MDFFTLFLVFILSVFLGYNLVWRVTPALHSPLMAVTNAISSIIVLGSVVALGGFDGPLTPSFFCFLLALFFCMINIVGGFFITHRMLEMFQGSTKRKKSFK